jgi:NADPH:quinone reductase-like Zn-dependent oxidoreductase
LAVKQNTDDLAYVRDLVDAGTIRPVIDNRFALPDTPKAFTRLGAGRAIGKIVIAIA